MSSVSELALTYTKSPEKAALDVLSVCTTEFSQVFSKTRTQNKILGYSLGWNFTWVVNGSPLANGLTDVQVALLRRIDEIIEAVECAAKEMPELFTELSLKGLSEVRKKCETIRTGAASDNDRNIFIPRTLMESVQRHIERHRDNSKSINSTSVKMRKRTSSSATKQTGPEKNPARKRWLKAWRCRMDYPTLPHPDIIEQVTGKRKDSSCNDFLKKYKPPTDNEFSEWEAVNGPLDHAEW